MSKENKSRYALLGALSMMPMSGYGLKKFIESSTNNFWSESYAQIYPMLKQLTQEGLAVSHTEKQEGRPERHVYSLTDAGWDALRNWLAEPVELQVVRNELLLKLFFGKRVPIAINLEHVQRFRVIIAQLLEYHTSIENSLRDQFAGNSDLPYWLITLNYGKHEHRALLAWCDETIATLQQLSHEE